MNKIETYIDQISESTGIRDEQQFYERLAIDEELRTDFKCFVSISDSIDKSLKNFAPSAAATSAIFSGLGISLPAGGTEQALIPDPVQGASFWGSSLFTGIVSSAGTLLIASLMFVGYGKFFKEETPSGNNLSQTSIPPQIIIQQIPAETPVKSTPISYKNLTARPMSHLASALRSLIARRELAEPIVQEPARIYYSRIGATHNNNFALNSPGYTSNNFNLNSPQILDNIYSIPGINNFSMDFSGNSAWDMPTAQASPERIASFNNMGIALMYDFSDNFKAGISLRQETFYTEYKGSEPDGVTYKYQQQTNFTTLGARLKYSPVNFASFYPFAGLEMGINNGGFIARPSLGVEYKAYNDISFVLGFEYSRFWFTHQNVWYNTAKSGINYGISYHF